MKKQKVSPCVGVCQYNGPKGWCIACGLTKLESKSWKSLKPFRKKALLNQLPKRNEELGRLNLKYNGTL